MQRRVTVAFAVLLTLTFACSDSVGPEERALDGPWSTGHALIGLGMALNLTWTRDRVSGSGGFSVPSPNIHCGTATISGAGTVVLTATRSSRTDIRGELKFGDGPPITYQGTLIDTLSVSGFARVQGDLVGPDGTRCGLTLFQGLVP